MTAPAQLRLSKLCISNFRGIRELEIDLPEAAPLHLIGSNNSCKSTVLEALHLVFGGPGTSKFEPSEFDYFHEADGTVASTFRIALHLAGEEKALPVVQGVGNPIRVHAIQLRGNTERGGRLTHRRTLLNDEGDEIAISSRTALKGKVKEEFEGAGVGWQQRYARVDEIRKSLPEAWLLTPRNLEASLFSWKSGPLMRLSQLLADRFLQDEWAFEYKGRDWPMPEKLVAAHDFLRASVDAFPFWKKVLRPRLEKIFAEYVGSQTGFDLRPSILALKEWLTQQLAVSFAAEIGGATTPLECMGDGWQSLIRLAALEALNEFPEDRSNRMVLLMEEPETHLHPHLQRKMRAVLNRLCEKGWFVATATHCPDLVSFAQAQTIVRLWRRGFDVTKGVFDTSNASDAVKLQDRLSERGNHEMLFASALVLCEGKADTWAIRTALSKIDPALDLDARSVSLVDVGGLGNLPDYAAVAQELGIRWCAITDEDKRPGQPANTVTEGVRARLEKIRSERDHCLMWPVDLEACLGCTDKSATPEWQTRNTDHKPIEELTKSHSGLIDVCRRICAWLG
jgi:putative ATP-dependent endonuclease of the OLD family